MNPPRSFSSLAPTLPPRLEALLHRPYTLVVLLGACTVLVLGADALHPDPALQAVLGAGAFLVLLALTATGDPQERRAAWACVGIATLIELFGSIIWGVYRYRLHNVPLYVPGGHGIVYVWASRLSRTPLFARHPRRTVQLAIAGSLIWAVGGLTLEPLLLHRIDIFGAFWCVYFVSFSLRTSRGTFFAAIFLITSLLELLGTGLADWTWQVTDPVLGVGVGNPPSVIAGGYCCIEATVILATRMAAHVLARLRGPAKIAVAAEPL